MYFDVIEFTIFQNNKKKHWFPQEKRTSFCAWRSFQDESSNSATFKKEFFATIVSRRKLKRARSNMQIIQKRIDKDRKGPGAMHL